MRASSSFSVGGDEAGRSKGLSSTTLATAAGAAAFLLGFFLVPLRRKLARTFGAPETAQAAGPVPPRSEPGGGAPAGGPATSGRDPRLEASEADLAENRPVDDEEPDATPSGALLAEASEADVLEQLRAEPLDEDDERR